LKFKGSPIFGPTSDALLANPEPGSINLKSIKSLLLLHFKYQTTSSSTREDTEKERNARAA